MQVYFSLTIYSFSSPIHLMSSKIIWSYPGKFSHLKFFCHFNCKFVHNFYLTSFSFGLHEIYMSLRKGYEVIHYHVLTLLTLAVLASYSLVSKLWCFLWRHTMQPGPQALIFHYASTSIHIMGFYLISQGNLCASPSSKESFYFRHKTSADLSFTSLWKQLHDLLEACRKNSDLFF